MDYVRLGHTGLKVSRIALGCMSYGSPKWREWVLEEEASARFWAGVRDVAPFVGTGTRAVLSARMIAS